MGQEDIVFSKYQNGEIIQEYQYKEDYGLLRGESIARCHIDSDHFVICMLDEPHMPCIFAQKQQPVSIEKIIVKIAV